MDNLTIDEIMVQFGNDFESINVIRNTDGLIRQYLVHVRFGELFYTDANLKNALLQALKDKPL